MDIIIVCHTEFGFVSGSKNLIYDKNATSGVTKGVLHLVTLAEKYHAKISFAVCPEVVPYFPKDTRHEIGLHVHPGWQQRFIKNVTWFSGDIYLKKHCKQSINSNFLADFSYPEQFEMINKGKEYLLSEFKREPKFFVPGKSSFNNDTLKAVVAVGFKAVASVFNGSRLHHPGAMHPRIRMPYYPDERNYQHKGAAPTLLIPVSQTIFGGSISPEGIRSYGFTWLKACFLEYANQGAPLFHMYLHSLSMTDPYYIMAMDDFLSYIAKQKSIHFKFVSEIKEYPQKKFTTNILPYVLGINRHVVKKLFLKMIRTDDK